MSKAASPTPEQDASSKRKAEQSVASEPPAAQEQRPAKQQKTIEESMGKSQTKHDDGTGESKVKQESNGSQKHGDDVNDDVNVSDHDDTNGVEKQPSSTNGNHDKHDESEARPASQSHDADTTPSNGIQESSARPTAQPPNLLEKGIIYFFTRSRVSVTSPSSIQDLARSYFVLRPLAPGAQITSGPIPDSGHNRLLSLPKKVWPKSGRDKFLVFVESAQTSMATLKSQFFDGEDYTTATAGSRHTPEVTPVGEGVYALTTSGEGSAAATHLSYLLTIPHQVGEVQRDVGIAERGSFVLSLKNPDAPQPANASLPEKPDFPQELRDQFRGRGWMPATRESLDYPKAQVLLIGEEFENSGTVDPPPNGQGKEEVEAPKEELEKLEGEDERRVQRLDGDDSVFADLGLDKNEFPAVLTTW